MGLSKNQRWTVPVLLLFTIEVTQAQEEEAICYGPGSMAAAVILTCLLTALLVGSLYFWWKRYKKEKDHLILETDPEKGKGEYAFDNAGFKDSTIFETMCKPEDTGKSDTAKTKWSQWSPLAALTSKSEKRKTLDDSALENDEVKVVALRSYDFTGLGFNICGNIKDGIYIKDINHRGPAFVSGKLNPGDRISSVTISFEHIVYEDALSILSYASPYEVIIEAKSGRTLHTPTLQGGRPVHPMYKSTSCTNLLHTEMEKDKSPLSSFQKPKSNVVTLERKESKSPNVSQQQQKKPKRASEQARQVETVQPKARERLQKSDLEVQKSENKFQKFGVKVLPVSDQKSPKSSEQNENNMNIEKLSIDEVDVSSLEKTPVAVSKEHFDRGDTQGSGIKRDKDGIPQEIPAHMLNAAVAAKRNRNSLPSVDPVPVEAKEEPKTPKKKGKAPSPPDESKTSLDSKTYNTDSEEEIDNNSSVNTVELNSSDITVHQTEQDEKQQQNRKTVSTGDLTRIQKNRKPGAGTLERAQSLDMSDSTVPQTLDKENPDLMRSEEDLFGKVELLSKEPRLSLILDGLNTFQRNRLKKSTEWGNLEDAILKLNQEDDSIVSVEDSHSLEEFDAVVSKIEEIKRESVAKPIKNSIWPELDGKVVTTYTPSVSMTFTEDEVVRKEIREEPKPISSPKPKVNNRIDEPFQKAVPLSSVERRQITDAVVVEPPPESTQQQMEPPKVTKRISRQRLPEETVPIPPPEEEVLDIMNTSPPPSLTLDDTEPVPVVKPEEVLSKIPLLNSMVAANNTDETKSLVTCHADPLDATQNFLYAEQLNCSQDYVYPRMYDTNVSDDMKVSRHAQQSPETQRHVSNISVTNNKDLHSLEFSINDDSDHYTTALEDNSRVTILTPDLIKNVTLAEAIQTVEKEHDEKLQSSSENGSGSTLTYVTEIQVTPQNSLTEIEIAPNSAIKRNLDIEFENYVKSFEAKLEQFESNIQGFDKNLEEFIKEEPKSIVFSEQVDEKELNKIHEIAEEQLKKLPEMRFTTSSYEAPSKIPEKRSSIEQLKSNFEKSPSKGKGSRIPIATATKTPPMSPARRDSATFDTENDKALLEFITSTPYAYSKQKSGSGKNVTVTSIRSNSKIPSSLPTLSGRPPVAPRKTEISSGDNTVQVPINGNSDSSFKQWVFNPSNVTNVTVTQNKQEK